MRFHLNRRDFLKSTVVTAAALQTAQFAHSESAPKGANDRLNIGMIGVGDRASAHLQELLSLSQKENVQIVALCDVWQKNLRKAAAKMKEHSGTEPKLFTRFGDLLQTPNIDAVVIATPDFSHGTILVAALEAKKDVYIEKPMTTDIASADKALELARRNNCVVQAGTQRRSEGGFIAASEFVKSGALGKLNRISASMDVNAPRWNRKYDNCVASDVDWDAYWLGKADRPFDARLLRWWQLFRATSNGMPGLWMTHYADAVHMLTGAQYPSRVVALGGTYVWKDGREHADTFHAILEYPEGFLFDWAMGLGNSAGIHFELFGTNGTLDIEKWTFSNEGAANFKPAELVTKKITPAHGTSHVQNWLQCVRSRQKPNADIQFGHQHAVTTILTAKAAETGKCQGWDAKKCAVVSN